MKTKLILLAAMVSLSAAQTIFALPLVSDADEASSPSSLSSAANNTLTTTPIQQNPSLELSQPNSQKVTSIGEDILAKVNSLEETVQQLQDRVDKLQHELKQTKEEQAKQFLILNQKTAAPVPAVASTPAPVQKTVVAKTDAPKVAAAVAPLPASSSNDQDKATYDAAYSLVSAKAYDDAIEAFSEYLKIFGSEGKYAGNANYWLGELNASQQKYPEAIKYLEIVVNQYPKSSKVSDAMLKLGIINKRLGDDTKAQVWFTKLEKQYPLSTQAKSAKQYMPNLG